MAKMPEEGRFEYGKMDKQTGAQWVHVTPEMARAHPQGRLNLALWLIVAVFAAFGLLDLYGYAVLGDGVLAISAFVKLLSALLLAIRAPVAMIVIGCQLLGALFFTVTGEGLRNISQLNGAGSAYVLFGLVFSGLALFYLVEGDRPNLIYRHRYRSFRNAKKD